MSNLNLRTTAEQSKSVAPTVITTMDIPVLAVSDSNASVNMTVGNADSIVDKAKAFLTKPITAGSKILYWHVALGAVVVFVLYVEMFADRKTQRKLKFW